MHSDGRLTLLILLLTFCGAVLMANCSKIAYKKTLDGKTNAIKEKRFKLKPEVITTLIPFATTTMPTTTTTPITKPTVVTAAIASSTSQSVMKNDNNDDEGATTPTLVTQLTATEAFVLVDEDDSSTEASLSAAETELINDAVLLDMSMSNQPLQVGNSIPTAQNQTADSDTYAITTISSVMSDTSSSPSATATNSKRNAPVPCTCGIFMTSQIKRGTNEPQGKPVILNELDRTYSCSSTGQKQCQTKCLEAIVQHLPNSANILCATLERDCHKERAYLYIKNCKNQWYNTKLAAGREYCCKNAQPYTCPMV